VKNFLAREYIYIYIQTMSMKLFVFSYVHKTQQVVEVIPAVATLA